MNSLKQMIGIRLTAQFLIFGSVLCFGGCVQKSPQSTVSSPEPVLLDEAKVNDMISAAWAAYRSNQLNESLQLGLKIIENRHTAGFEIAGRSYLELRDYKKLNDLMNFAITKNPISIFWELKGSALSELGLYQEAESSFDKALGSHGAWKASIMVKKAQAYASAGQVKQALKILDQVEDSTETDWDRFLALLARMSILVETDQYKEADQYWNLKAKDSIPKTADLPSIPIQHQKSMGRLWFLRATISFEGLRLAKQSLVEINNALKFDPQNLTYLEAKKKIAKRL